MRSDQEDLNEFGFLNLWISILDFLSKNTLLEVLESDDLSSLVDHATVVADMNWVVDNLVSRPGGFIGRAA